METNSDIWQLVHCSLTKLGFLEWGPLSPAPVHLFQTSGSLVKMTMLVHAGVEFTCAYDRPIRLSLRLSLMFCGMEYFFSQFGSAVLALLSHSFLHTYSWAEPETLRSPSLRVSTAQWTSVILVITLILSLILIRSVLSAFFLILNPKHNTVPPTIPAEVYPSWNQDIVKLSHLNSHSCFKQEFSIAEGLTKSPQIVTEPDKGRIVLFSPPVYRETEC